MRDHHDEGDIMKIDIVSFADAYDDFADRAFNRPAMVMDANTEQRYEVIFANGKTTNYGIAAIALYGAIYREDTTGKVPAIVGIWQIKRGTSRFVGDASELRMTKGN